MLDKIIGNDKAKFMTNYTKLANELNDFLIVNPKLNGLNIKTDKISMSNRMNILINEKFSNDSKQKAKSILSNDKNIFDKNIFGDDVVKKEKWQNLKNSINTLNNQPHPDNTNSVFDKIKNNLNNMKKQFTLEEAFQKNMESLNGLNIISPRNKICNNLSTKIKYNENSCKINDPILLNNLNNSKNIASSLKYKFNQYYLKQRENDNYTLENSDKKKNLEKTPGFSLNHISVRKKMLDFLYDDKILNITERVNKPKSNLFDRKDKLKDDIISVLDNKKITRIENGFYKKKHHNLFTWSNDSSHKNSTRTTNNVNLDDSYDKVNNIINNYYEETKKIKSSNSLSKNADIIKRFKNRFERGSKIILFENEIKPSKKFIKTNFDVIRPRTSILDNYNKFEKKHLNTRENINSDILRLELINLNCYSINDIETLKGIEKLKSKRRKSSSINQL